MSKPVWEIAPCAEPAAAATSHDAIKEHDHLHTPQAIGAADLAARSIVDLFPVNAPQLSPGAVVDAFIVDPPNLLARCAVKALGINAANLKANYVVYALRKSGRYQQGQNKQGGGEAVKGFRFVSGLCCRDLSQIIDKLRRRRHAAHQQPVTRPCASHVQQMPLCVVHLLQIGLVHHAFDA